MSNEHRSPSRSTSERRSSTIQVPWRTVRPEYVHRLPPCNHACPPAGISGLARARRSGAHTKPPGGHWSEQSGTGRRGAGSAIIHAKARAIAVRSIQPSASIPSNAFSATSQSKGWAFEPAAASSAKEDPRRRRGAVSLSAAYHLARTRPLP